MSSQTTTFDTAGTDTFIVPATLVGGSVYLETAGAASGYAGTSTRGPGGEVNGTAPVSPGDTLSVYVGDASGNGYHPGGTAATQYVPGQPHAQNGGGSTAILKGSTVLVEAPGGGGPGGPAPHAAGGAGGKGGLAPSPGGSGGKYHTGASPNYGGGGAGGGGHQGNGQGGDIIGSSPGGAAPAGGAAPGGAGREFNSGVQPLDNWGGGGGAGGQAYVDPSIASPTFNDGGWTSPTGLARITAVVADAPLASTLGSPTNGAFLDSNAAGATFTATYNPGTDSGTCSGYCLRISQDGGAYQYWNGTALVGTATWVAATSLSVTIPAGILADGHTYSWSIAAEESHYNLQGPFASDQVFTAAPMPTIVPTVVLDSGSATPTVNWTETLGGGDTQTSFQVRLFTTAQAAIPGFSPGTSPATVDSGVTASAGLTWTCPTVLAPGGYVAYVQVVETGPLASSWTSAGAFTVVYDAPATPTMTATPDADPLTTAPTAQLVVVTHDNHLSTDDASFETSLGTHTPVSHCTLAQISSWEADGLWAEQMTATAAADMSETTAGSYTVTGGVTYTAMATFHAETTGRSVKVGITWKDATHTTISTVYGTPATDGTLGGTTVTVTAAAPSNAAYCELVGYVASPALGEKHDVDSYGLFTASTAPAWSRGGIYGVSSVSVTYSDDGGATWTPVRGGSGIAVPTTTEQVTVIDTEVPFGAVREYQAIVSAPITVPAVTTVDSAPGAAAVTVESTQWWLTDPLDTTVALGVHRLGTVGVVSSLNTPVSFQKTTSETQAAFEAFGRPDPIVQHGTVHNPVFTLNCLLEGYGEAATLQDLQARQRTLLLRSDMGDLWYFDLGPDLVENVLRATDRIRNPLTAATVTVQVTKRP